jgi:antitoxin (DNA-binding transcriptional repressor) of toxin-antitoxin stability system
VAATVARRGDTLTVTVPGQPTYTLVPWREREYRLEGLEGYSLRVELEDGRCTQVTFVQPNGSFPAERAAD